jgi:Na+-driven multidrug efflux pump
MGDAIAIIIGQRLGAKEYDKAKEETNKIIAFAVFIATLVGIIIASTSHLFPMIYNTTDEAKKIAAQFLIAQAVFTPQIALLHTTYFTLRSGGKTVITFLFDSVFMWVVSVPVAYILSRYTDIYVIWIFVALQMADWIKCAIGVTLVRKGVWMNNIVSD